MINMVERSSLKLIGLLLYSLVAYFALPACTGMSRKSATCDVASREETRRAPAADRKSEHLVISVESGPSVADPSLTNLLPNTVWIQQTVFDQLQRFNENGDVEPGLATKVQTSSDGKTVTFDLRKGVKFQSTDSFQPSPDFTAEDVIFTFDPNFHSSFPYWKIKGLDRLIESMTFSPNNPYQLTFHLREARPDFSSVLAMGAFSIRSKEYFEFLRNQAQAKAEKKSLAKDSSVENAIRELEAHPIGTGPYQFVSLADGHLELRARDQSIQPALISIIGRTDSRARVLDVIEGRAEIATSPELADFVHARERYSKAA